MTALIVNELSKPHPRLRTNMAAARLLPIQAHVIVAVV